MKKYAIPAVVVLAVLAVTWSAFAQAQDRAAMRERYQNMSEEERAKFREQMRARGGAGSRRGGFMNAEAQASAIKAIEDQLAKLKAIEMPSRPQNFQDMSDEERNKLRETMTKVFRERNAALQAIIAQVAALQGRRQPAPEGAQYMILNTNDLRPALEAAKKEKAEETGRLLQGLMARGSGRGFGGGRPGGAGRPQGGGRRGGNQ